MSGPDDLIDYVEAWDLVPRVLPVPWQHALATEQVAFEGRGLFVIMSASLYNGERWLHVSASGRGRVPSYAELAEIKRVFVGRDRLALQLFPPAAEHVNIHPHVLHLWAPLDHRPVPDFRLFGQV